MNKKSTKNRTINTATAVANEVIEKVRKGKKVSISGIMLKHGYSKSSSRALKVKTTSAFKSIIDSLLEKMDVERTEVLKLMNVKRKSASYAVLSMALRNLNHDIQLLGGKATERVDIPISEDEKDRLQKLINRNQSDEL